MAPDCPTVDEIDEALTWTAKAPHRDERWWEWVDQLLDDRLEATSS